MFDAAPSPELPAAFEPTELPGVDETPAGPEGTEPAAAPAAEHQDAGESLAQVVAPRFGFERLEAEDESPEVEDDEPAQVTAEVEAPDETSDQADDPLTGTNPWARPAAWGTAAVTSEPEPEEAPLRFQIRRPLSAAATSALEGDFVADGARSDDSPIFGQLRSNWLSDDGEEQEETWSANEVDRGWDAAELAESTDAESTTRTGLPVRRPGGRLLPGGVSSEPAKVVRDPESIRNRLAAHAAGVSRGRAAAAAEPDTHDYAHEETGPA
jgi:hypothetical protein